MPRLKLKCPECYTPVLDVEINNRQEAIANSDVPCPKCGANTFPRDRMLASWDQVESQMAHLKRLEAQGLIKLYPPGTPGKQIIAMSGYSNDDKLVTTVIEPEETKH